MLLNEWSVKKIIRGTKHVVLFLFLIHSIQLWLEHRQLELPPLESIVIGHLVPLFRKRCQAAVLLFRLLWFHGMSSSILLCLWPLTMLGGNDRKMVVYFYGVEKGLICNSTNLNAIASILKSDETDDWTGGQK